MKGRETDKTGDMEGAKEGGREREEGRREKRERVRRRKCSILVPKVSRLSFPIPVQINLTPLKLWYIYLPVQLF